MSLSRILQRQRENFVGLAKVNSLLPENERLRTVKDPQKQLAEVTKGDYVDFRTNFGQFERDVVEESLADTTLIDQAPTTALASFDVAAGINRRQRERRGVSLTQAQNQQLNRNIQTGATLGTLDAMNQGALAQRDINTKRFFDQINIGQGVSQTAQGLLGTAADLKARRDAAAKQASEAAKAQRTQTVLTLATLAAFGSDARLKQNITKVGELANGLGLYTWEWNDIAHRLPNNSGIVLGDTIGVIAQELEEIHPDLVLNTKSGYKAVDYNRLRYRL